MLRPHPHRKKTALRVAGSRWKTPGEIPRLCMLSWSPGRNRFFCFLLLLLLLCWICTWLNPRLLSVPHCLPLCFVSHTLQKCGFSQSGASKKAVIVFRCYVADAVLGLLQQHATEPSTGPHSVAINFGSKRVCCSVSYFIVWWLGMQLFNNLKSEIKNTILFVNFSPCGKYVNTYICNQAKYCSWKYIDFSFF